MRFPSLPIRTIPPEMPITPDLSLAQIETIGVQSGALAAQLPLISLTARERLRLSGYLFPLCDAFVVDVGDAIVHHQDLFGPDAPSAPLRVVGAELVHQQTRATRLRALARRFEDLSQICSDLALRDQASGIVTAMSVMREVRARYASPHADLKDRQRECMLWAGAESLAARSPRARPARPTTPEAKEAQRQQRARQRQRARDHQTQRAREVIADCDERLRLAALAQPPAAAPPAAPPPIVPSPIVPPPPIAAPPIAPPPIAPPPIVPPPDPPRGAAAPPDPVPATAAPPPPAPAPAVQDLHAPPVIAPADPKSLPGWHGLAAIARLVFHRARLLFVEAQRKAGRAPAVTSQTSPPPGDPRVH